ncbi:MAG: hypothetical protein ACFFDH_24225 [Promethearchaeota archaeon]
MENIFSELSKNLPVEYVNLIEEEYIAIKNSYIYDDKIKLGIHSGRFCEVISSLLCYTEFKQKDILNRINFNKNINRLESSSKGNATEELVRLVIPKILRSIYTIRSKKKIAHIKEFNPQKIDIKLVKISVDWIISQLLLIFCNINDEKILKFLEKISYESYESIEQFENGEILFKDPNLSLSKKILIVLLENYNNGKISTQDINKILKPKNKSYITTYLNRLKLKNFVHINNKGVQLTKWGLAEAYKILQNLY